jgi:MOSC domain-containing protein YiiM
MNAYAGARVVAVSRSSKHGVQKPSAEVIELRAGLGVDGDVHAGVLVRHRYDRRRDPNRPNDRQVHLIAAELFDELSAEGFAVRPGELGENITTRGIDLAALPMQARLSIGADAVVELRMLREPCVLLDRVAQGLCAATTILREGRRALRHGVMGVVICSGAVRAGDVIRLDMR